MFGKVTFTKNGCLIFMNPFEQYTLIIGVLAVLIEGFSRLRDFVQKVIHKGAE
jgi:hypothetical protein